jgi:hypothetical protein
LGIASPWARRRRWWMQMTEMLRGMLMPEVGDVGLVVGGSWLLLVRGG